ncbi:tetratricopeptide repeat protein [Candidatus Methanocrinis natronophilus]|uniref:tetratricopeptide repeat protein n=1 Tax=Candidatus Methanocrinis natronophilus TaxID=3033396 RepID=UPI00374340CB
MKTPAKLDFLRPPTIEHLRTEILGGYDVVHFDGHGSFGRRCPNCSGLNPPESNICGRCSASLEDEEAGGYLAFEGEDGTVDSLAAEDLARMINAVPGRPTKLVILSACESAKGGEASLLAVLRREGVPAVLGMKEPVPVELTVALSRPLYAFLGAGLEIGEAFCQALSSISKLSQSEPGTPAPDIPVLEGEGTRARIVDRPMRGEVVVGRERIFGVPEYDFVGEFIRGDPPRGRKGLLARTVRALLAGERLVVLTGQGGIGKSVLGAEAARRIAWRYPGGVFWRSGADIENLGLNELLDGFVNVFGYEFRTRLVDEKRDIVLGYLRDFGTASLIVVDNAETIKDPAVFRFLEGMPKPSASLVTSREALEREGAHIDIDEMEPSEATRLFIVEARRRKSGWGKKLTSSDLEALEVISRHLDGHPLAIKLAAAMVGSDSLATICQRVLAAPHKEVSTRFDFSYNPLPASEKELLHRMAAFASSATEEVIQLACAHPDFVGDKVLPQWRDDLTELVRKSFVDTVPVTAFDDSGNEVTWQRYRLHSLMRQYAAGKAGEEAMKIHRQRAANLFLVYAEQFRQNFDALEAERKNVFAGMDWAYQLKGTPDAQEIVIRYASALLQAKDGVIGYLLVRGYWFEARKRAEQALEVAYIKDDKKSLASAYRALGLLSEHSGNHSKAERYYLDSLKIEHMRRNRSGVSITLNQLGSVAYSNHSWDKAYRCYSVSLRIKRELDDKRGIAYTLGNLGNLALRQEDTPEARSLFLEVLDICEKLKDEDCIARAYFQLSELAQKENNLEEARTLIQKSLNILRRSGEKHGIALNLARLGTIEQSVGNYVAAIQMWTQAYVLLDELKSPDKSFINNSFNQLRDLLGVEEFENVCREAGIALVFK